MVCLKRRTWRIWISGLAIVAVVSCLGARNGNADECVLDTLGLDLALVNSSRSLFNGRAIGQTFRARDTVLRRVTVWRPPRDIQALGTKLFITAVDTLRVPPRPMTQDILRAGPTVLVNVVNPPEEWIRMDFIIDPPLVLPRPGIYAMFFQREGCDVADITILGNENDPYPDGVYWITGRVTTLPCFLRSVETWEEHFDFIFETEFCRDATTMSRTHSWGELKIIYR
jgi:hypothetical protein